MKTHIKIFSPCILTHRVNNYLECFSGGIGIRGGWSGTWLDFRCWQEQRPSFRLGSASSWKRQRSPPPLEPRIGDWIPEINAFVRGVRLLSASRIPRIGFQSLNHLFLSQSIVGPSTPTLQISSSFLISSQRIVCFYDLSIFDNNTCMWSSITIFHMKSYFR